MSDNDNPKREASSYPQIVRAVRETPWALLPSTMAAILDMVALRAAGERFSAEEIQARIGAGPATKDLVMAGSVAVLPVYGVLVPKADLFSEMSGGASVQRLSAAFRAAVADEDVSAIVLDVDSPGGQTDMIPEFAAEIRAARGKKPIVAVASTQANSAGYWLAAQADEFYATQSARVGSIGVFAAHEDISVLQEKLGVKTTLVTAGKFKAEGHPFEPLSDEARESIQGRVDEMYQTFTADVAKGRKVPVETVRSGFGEGRTLTAKKALKEGMIDGIATLQEVVDRVQPKPTGGSSAANLAVSFTGTTSASDIRRAIGLPPPKQETDTETEAAESGLSFADESFALHESAEALVERLSSLAEVERGRLTAAKRESLQACPGALREAAQRIESVLVATDPDKHRKELLAEVARSVVLRSHPGGKAA